MRRIRRLIAEDERAHVRSDAAGAITFNHLQQSEPDDTEDGRRYPSTTDPWDITDGAVESP